MSFKIPKVKSHIPGKLIAKIRPFNNYPQIEELSSKAK